MRRKTWRVRQGVGWALPTYLLPQVQRTWATRQTYLSSMAALRLAMPPTPNDKCPNRNESRIARLRGFDFEFDLDRSPERQG